MNRASEKIDRDTLVRLRITAARAMETSLDSYRRLMENGRASPPPETPYGHAPLFAAIAEEVSRLTMSIADELLFLCRLSISAGIMHGDVRRKLADMLGGTIRDPRQPVDLRRQRIRRMPAGDGLHIVMDSLDSMCDQVDALIASLPAGGDGRRDAAIRP
ncbi:hypothetical protein [Dongia sp.]|uniref:hypothetical protein n=1 Tax=Dongia sp. TaxID=1977262 RepID=UPI0035B0A07A